ILASVLFVIGAFVFFDRIGRKPEAVPDSPRVQVVNLSGSDGVGAMALHAVDRVVGLPGAVAGAVTGRGDDQEARQDQAESDEMQ
ncbi:MAG: hypothetical protein K8I30_04585, partial [Anaerolineae bacterium]|nr:hypothetical protein [Anaerolineae bacterium]